MSYDPTDLRLEFASGLLAEMGGGEGGSDCLLPPTSFLRFHRKGGDPLKNPFNKVIAFLTIVVGVALAVAASPHVVQAFDIFWWLRH